MRLCYKCKVQPVFSTDKLTGLGYCKSHQYLRTDTDKRTPLQKALAKQADTPQIEKKLRFPEKREPTKAGWFDVKAAFEPEVEDNESEDKINKAEMDLFWLTAEKELAQKPYCAECGAFIPKQYYRSATAHVLPKRKEYGFPSISANQINRLFLGAGCSCHGRYDRSWEDAAKMKIFPLAIEIFKKLYPLIHKSERKNIPEVLMQEIEPNG